MKKETENNINSITIEIPKCKFAHINTKDFYAALSLAKNEKRIEITPNGEEKIRYINERNYYGEKPTLITNAILLFFYCHFLYPDERGNVKLRIKDAAENTGMCERTVRRVLKGLSEKGYIEALPYGHRSGEYFVTIKNYGDIQKSVEEGGKGYIALPYSIFEEIKETKFSNINELRLVFRSIVGEVDGLNKYRLRNTTTFAISKLLPSYVSGAAIKRLLANETFKKFCNATLVRDSCDVTIVPRDKFNVRILKKENDDAAYEEIKNTISSLTNIYKKNLRLTITENDVHDMVGISHRYSISDIKEGLSTFFRSYHNKDTRGNNFNVGGMVRTLTQEAVFLRVNSIPVTV